jgi:hypothetical protein
MAVKQEEVNKLNEELFLKLYESKADWKELQVTGFVDGGILFSEPMTYFNQFGNTLEDSLKDILVTMELNPPDSMKIVFPDGSEHILCE